jgi:flagellar L-ring protein FlgH
MKYFRPHQTVAGCLFSLALVAVCPDNALAQNSSLFARDIPQLGPELTLANTSWVYQAIDPPKPIKLNDLVTVIVLETSQFQSKADLNRRKQAQLNAQLKDWVKLDGLNIQPAPQSSGDEAVNGTLQSQYRSNNELGTTDLIKFSIQARVVDIRPNGHLVLEAHQKVRNNDEQSDQFLSGIVRPEDILPNNTILSEKVAELQIHKREKGSVRDGYRRGWAFLFLDRFGMF